MKILSAGLILALSTSALANNVNIVKTFDGRAARCGETADVGNSAYRLKNGTVVVSDSSLTLRLSVNSLVCAKTNNRSGVGLVAQAPNGYNNAYVQVASQKLLLTDENYNVIGAHAIAMDSANTDAEMVIALTEAQKESLKKGQALDINMNAFIQAIVKVGDESSLSGSGEFRVNVNIDGGLATMSIK